MKSILKAFAAFFLAALARGVLKKYRPMVVMVTGSVGKTSTKDAVAAALAPSFYLWKSEKSYNSEVGVPLTIIGAKNAWGSVSGWFKVFRQGLALIALPSHYPKLLVLEVGADRPGDLAKILRIATPDVVVVTKLPDVPVHVEAYASPEAVREEEFAPAYALPVGAPLIISSDNSYAPEMASRLPARVITYGANKDATVFIDTPELYLEDGVPAGMHAKVTIDTKTYELRAVGVTGRPQIYAPAAALATAIALGVKPTEALAGLEAYEPPPGRGRLLAGHRRSVLIDDSYNSSPTASEEALASLALIPNATRRIAVLGDMLELGRYSMAEHQRIGRLAAERADMVIGVGQRARALVEAAIAAGVSEDQTRLYNTSLEAAESLKELLQKGDAVLIKGSQSIRTERIVEALLANSEDLQKLVRQDAEWKRR